MIAEEAVYTPSLSCVSFSNVQKLCLANTQPVITATYFVVLIYEKQMMYVSGETAEASAETTGMIEEIVRQQVIEMVR